MAREGADIDMREVARRVLLEHGFRPDVPRELDDTVARDEWEGAEDLRHLAWSSIDNETSRDLDQLEYAERLDGGAIRMFVAIADGTVAKGGRVVDLELQHKNRARELVEDLMIAVNSATARFLEMRGYSSIRRVVRAPKRWDRIVELAAELGAQLPREPDRRALADFVVGRRQADPERFADVSLSIVKLLGPGEYVLQRSADPDIGHFGLAVDDYAHSTAPNRRYPDLITQP